MDNRHHSRIPVDPRGSVRFKLGGHIHEAIAIADLGVDGCCIQAPLGLGALLKDHPLLLDWQFVGAPLPRESITARVVWVEPGGRSRGNGLRTGVQFQKAPASYGNSILRYVAMQAKGPATDAH